MENIIALEEAAPERWSDLQTLFGEKGAYGGCWCTYFRMRRSEFASRTGNERKEIMSELINSGKTPGIIAYMDGKPVGWCSIGPREDFVLLSLWRITKPIDSEQVWSIVCFYIDKKYRKKGVMKSLIKGSLAYAKKKGANIVEAYPIDPGDSNYPEPYAYTGIYRAFIDTGFEEVGRRTPKRPIMRYYMKNKD